MVKAINFTGIYRISRPEVKRHKNGKIGLLQKRNVTKQASKQDDLLRMLDTLDSRVLKYKIGHKQLNAHSTPTNLGYDIFVVSPNDMDEKIDEMCNKAGVKFEKTETPNLTFTDVLDRIEPTPIGKKLVFVDAEVLDFIFEKALDADSNIPQTKFGYTASNALKVNDILKGDGKIPLTTLHIRPSSEYINGYSVNFVKQKENTPDECVYFALKNLGFKKIPVFVDTTTKDNAYENSTEYYCRRLGLISNDNMLIYV